MITHVIYIGCYTPVAYPGILIALVAKGKKIYEKLKKIKTKILLDEAQVEWIDAL